MKNLTLILSAFTLLLFSCKKEESTTPDVPKVALQTEYRLSEIKSDSGTAKTYEYNAQDLVSKVTSYYDISQFHYTQPGTAVVSYFYEYDDNFRIIKSGSSINADEDDSKYTYNADLLPITRYKEKYDHPLYEYKYAGNKLTELKTYDVKGQLVSTETWAYDKGDDNATSHTITSGNNTKFETRYLAYDNAHATRLAMPGIQDIELATSVNNVLKTSYTTYDANGNQHTIITEYKYEYNQGNYPVKRIATTTDNGTTKQYPPLYYIYNK